jgi:hypothetical protein
MDEGVSSTGHELSKNHSSLRREEGERGAACRAPIGAAVEDAFQQFWHHWQRGHSDDETEVRYAFMEACAGDDVTAIMASAERWLKAKAGEPNFLPEPLKWLRGGWRKPPGNKKPTNGGNPGGKPDLANMAWDAK